MIIMKFKKWVKLLESRESIKDDRLNKILDKISSNSELSERERQFLDNYDIIDTDDTKDFTYLSRDVIYKKIIDLLDDDKVVVCDLYDRDGKINRPIESIFIDYESSRYYLIVDSKRIELKDNFLYNLIYNDDEVYYSLQSQDEYFEEIPLDKI